LKKPLLIFLATATFVLACYIGYLDYTVRRQFEGKRWSIPARVYARSVELYAGLQMDTKQLLALLQKMHYRADRKLSSPATYHEKAKYILIFRFKLRSEVK
jgi:penicillin-binding protein 1B